MSKRGTYSLFYEKPKWVRERERERVIEGDNVYSLENLGGLFLPRLAVDIVRKSNLEV